MLVFTQSLGTLDILERALKTKFEDVWPFNWKLGRDYLRLDGKTTASDRKTMTNQFNRPENKPWVFLMSVKVLFLRIAVTVETFHDSLLVNHQPFLYAFECSSMSFML